MHELNRRRAATAKVWAKFRQRPFDWDKGGTCIHLGRAQLRAMGHRPPPIPRFYSALGARRALVKAGFGEVADIFRSLGLPEIPAARLWVGDIAIVPGEGMDSICIWSGDQLLGYHQDSDGGVVAFEGEDMLAHVKVAFRL